MNDMTNTRTYKVFEADRNNRARVMGGIIAPRLINPHKCVAPHDPKFNQKISKVKNAGTNYDCWYSICWNYGKPCNNRCSWIYEDEVIKPDSKSTNSSSSLQGTENMNVDTVIEDSTMDTDNSNAVNTSISSLPSGVNVSDILSYTKSPLLSDDDNSNSDNDDVPSSQDDET